ncbi:MAG: hypothetical protein C0193_00105 [Candidatus Bathyarchaeota archaeon]|nr:MAG: hypothetical protein C0193_00105 [Candidatus Bathyarchaeota archaeon]
MTAMEKIDKILGTRQLLYTLLIIAIILPILYPVGLPIGISSRTRAVYDYIEDDSKLPPGSHVLVEIYYEVAARAELEPQVIALMKHLFEKNCKLVFLSTATYGPLAFQFLQTSAPDLFEGKTYGEDYVFLGYIAGGESTLASLARSITGTVATDNYGNPASSLPLIQEANDATAYELVVIASSGTDTFSWYIRQWYTPYHTPLLFGALSVIAPSIEPYVGAGQAIGMLTGQRSAAEYELLVGRKGLGIASMDAQSLAHGLILLFIILGNIVFAYTKLSKRGEKK